MNLIEKDDFVTVAVLRAFRDSGHLIALFPYDDQGNGLIGSYMVIGQHGTANYTRCMQVTRPLTEEESLELRNELESLGYNLEIRKSKRGAK